MNDKKTSYHPHLYTAIVILGVIVVITSIYMSNSKIDFFEHNTNRIHRLITSSQLELDTLEREAKAIENTLEELSAEIKDKPSQNKQRTRQFLALKENIPELHSEIAEKQKLLITLNLLKTETLSQIKTLFWVNSSLLVIGSLMILIGGAALGLHLEVFQDRRENKRD